MERRFLNHYSNSKGEYFKEGDLVMFGKDETVFKLEKIRLFEKRTTQVILTNPDLLRNVTTTIGRISLHPSQFEKKPRFPTIESLPNEFYVVQRSTLENIILFNRDCNYSNHYFKQRSVISAHPNGTYAFVRFSKYGKIITTSLFFENGYSKNELTDLALNFIKDKTLLSAEEFYKLFKTF